MATLHRNCHSPSLGLTVKLSIVRTIFENGCLNLSPQKKNQWKIEQQGKRFNNLATIRRASLRARRKLASSLARPICDLDFSRRPQPFCHDKTEPPG